jgi:SAM-dependent methyltransferase
MMNLAGRCQLIGHANNMDAIDQKKRMVKYYATHPEYYQLLEKLCTSAPDVEGMHIESLIRSRNEHCISPLEYRILDVGCGSGSVLIALTNRLCEKPFGLNNNILPRSCGMDLSKHAIAVAEEKNKNKRCYFTQLDAESDFPFATNVFETVYSTHALEHMVDPGKVLNNMIRVTTADGFIYLTFPGLFKCFSNPYADNGIPILDRILKVYDAFRMLFNKKYVQFRFIKPSLKSICEDSDMVFLSFTPEIVRYLEQRGFRVIDYDMRGRVVAIWGEPMKDWLRPVKYLGQFLRFIIELGVNYAR